MSFALYFESLTNWTTRSKYPVAGHWGSLTGNILLPNLECLARDYSEEVQLVSEWVQEEEEMDGAYVLQTITAC